MTTLRNQNLVCPHCQNKMYVIEVMSFTVKTSESFSDGRIINLPSRIISPNILLCNICYNAFWKNDALCNETNYDDFSEELLGANTINDLFPKFHKDSKFKEVKYYLKLLKEGFANSDEREIYIRLEIWRALNDKIRYDENLEIEINDSLFNANLKKLIKIFKMISDEQKLLVVEMYRELGEFKKANILLESIIGINQTSVFKKIKDAIRCKQSKVFKI